MATQVEWNLHSDNELFIHVTFKNLKANAEREVFELGTPTLPYNIIGDCH